MQDANDPTGARDPARVGEAAETRSSGYGWVPIAIAAALLLAILILLPIGADQSTRTLDNQNTNTSGTNKPPVPTPPKWEGPRFDVASLSTAEVRLCAKPLLRTKRTPLRFMHSWIALAFAGIDPNQ